MAKEIPSAFQVSVSGTHQNWMLDDEMVPHSDPSCTRGSGRRMTQLHSLMRIGDDSTIKARLSLRLTDITGPTTQRGGVSKEEATVRNAWDG
jgi:hypothetical protein